MEYRILGAGLTGLVLAECLCQNGVHKSDIKLYGEFDKSQSSCRIELGPRILHETKKVNKFLEKLGVDLDITFPNRYEIKYIDDDYKFIDKETALGKYDRESTKNASSFGKIDNIVGYSFYELNLLNRLQDKYKYQLINIHLDKDNINEVWKEESDNSACYFSTLPIRSFGNIFKDFKYEDSIEDLRIIVSRSNILDINISRGDIIYDTSTRYLKRIYRGFSYKNYYSYEFQSGFGNKNFSNDLIGKLYKNGADSVVVDISGVRSVGGISPIYSYKNIKLVGREATCDKTQLIHNIIENKDNYLIKEI